MQVCPNCGSEKVIEVNCKLFCERCKIMIEDCGDIVGG